MLSLLLFVVAYVVDESTCLTGHKVCRDINGSEYCCSDHEEVNGVCIECKIGYKSIQGQSCKACDKNRFGERCINRCNCVSWQRCDNVQGCVQGVVTAFNTTADNGCWENMLMYQLISTACSVIFIVGTCFVCRRLQKKRARGEVAADESNSTPIQITCSRNNSYISKEENVLINNTLTYESTGAIIVSIQQDADNDEESSLHPYSYILRPKVNVGQEECPL